MSAAKMSRASKVRQIDAVLKLIMRSSAMKQLYQRLCLVAPKDVVLLFIGESGTGKEVLARLAHEQSARRRGPFIPINCTAIPESLFESELFGHERGAFTGASERVLGKIEAASGGTLFLDELGEMPFAMQAKLLRFLENRRFMRVGGSIKLQADVRLMCATLRPLEEDVRAGRFRGDLFYRIQGITLRVPPLRERRLDFLPMLHEFTAELAARHATAPPRFPRGVISTLLNYSWPGNVRELRTMLELLCLIRENQAVRMQDLPESIARTATESGSSRPHELRVSLDEPLAAITEQVISAALRLEEGNRTRTAARLGISLRTLQRALAVRSS